MATTVATAYQFKIVLAGDGGVGKSALAVKLCDDRFVIDYNPTIEDSFTKVLEVDGKSILLSLLDTAGQEEYAALLEQHFTKADGFLLVFAVTSKDTFLAITKHRDNVVRVHQDQAFPIVIAGNKADLEPEREVAPSEAKQLCQGFGCPYFETSAKLGTNVDVAFKSLTRAILAYRKRKAGAGGSASHPAKKNCCLLC